MLKNSEEPASQHAIMTVDLEDWFHGLEHVVDTGRVNSSRIVDETKYLLDLFDLYQSKATFFVLGICARQKSSLIQHIVSRGHTIGSHGMQHQPVNQLSHKAFSDDIRASIETLSGITGDPVTLYRAPFFSLNASMTWAYEILMDAGIRVDSSSFPTFNPHFSQPWAYRLPHRIMNKLLEIPVSTLPTFLGNMPFAGGAYFRMLPWRFIDYACGVLEKRGEPLIMYFHPYDLDSDQPRLKLKSRFHTWRRYYGIESSTKKFTKLLIRNRFTTMSAMMI